MSLPQSWDSMTVLERSAWMKGESRLVAMEEAIFDFQWEYGTAIVLEHLRANIKARIEDLHESKKPDPKTIDILEYYNFELGCVIDRLDAYEELANPEK